MTARYQARRAAHEAELARRERYHEEIRVIVAAGACPMCGDGLRRNSSIAGWFQCEQSGAVGFRKDPTQPACSWQGFAE